MATDPKHNQWIYGTKECSIRMARERRDDLISRQSTIPPLVVHQPSHTNHVDPFVSSPRDFVGGPLPDVPAPAGRPGPVAFRGGAVRPARDPKPLLINLLCGVAGFVGFAFAASRGVKSELGLGLAFVAAFVAARVVGRYLKVIVGIAVIGFGLYTIISGLAGH